MLLIKHGVKFGNPTLAMAAMLDVVEKAYHEHSMDCVLTSAAEGRHSRGSLHYVSLALDFRTNHISTEARKDMIVGKIKQALGPDFDVLLEGRGTVNEHLHAEYQVKEPL